MARRSSSWQGSLLFKATLSEKSFSDFSTCSTPYLVMFLQQGTKNQKEFCNGCFAPLKVPSRTIFKVSIPWGWNVDTCGLADQHRVHKHKVVGSSPVTANMLSPWVSHFTIITPLDPGVWLGTGNGGKVTGSLWPEEVSRTPQKKNWVWPIRVKREMGTPNCIHRLKAYLTFPWGSRGSIKRTKSLWECSM